MQTTTSAVHNTIMHIARTTLIRLPDPVAPNRRAASPRPEAADAAAEGSDAEHEQVAVDQDAPAKPRLPQQGLSWEDTLELSCPTSSIPSAPTPTRATLATCMFQLLFCHSMGTLCVSSASTHRSLGWEATTPPYSC
jgi:hypothetical protein